MGKLQEFLKEEQDDIIKERKQSIHQSYHFQKVPQVRFPCEREYY